MTRIEPTTTNEKDMKTIYVDVMTMDMDRFICTENVEIDPAFYKLDEVCKEVLRRHPTLKGRDDIVFIPEFNKPKLIRR